MRRKTNNETHGRDHHFTTISLSFPAKALPNQGIEGCVLTNNNFMISYQFANCSACIYWQLTIDLEFHGIKITSWEVFVNKGIFFSSFFVYISHKTFPWLPLIEAQRTRKKLKENNSITPSSICWWEQEKKADKEFSFKQSITRVGNWVFLCKRSLLNQNLCFLFLVSFLFQALCLWDQ